MATKGYNSYHGRMSGGKIALIVALALVLVGAVAYLTLQNYVVYDEAGNARLELPFLHRKDKEEPDDTLSAGDRDDIVDTVEPEHPHVKVAALHGVRLPDDCLWWGADYIMNTLAPEDMVLAVKRTTGGITYGTSVETPAGVVVETGRPIDCLKTLLASGRYTVGSVVCFRDSAYSRSVPETALVREDGSLWYDNGGQAWLDPTNPQVLQGGRAGSVLLSGERGGRQQPPCGQSAGADGLCRKAAGGAAGGRGAVGDGAGHGEPEHRADGGAVRPAVCTGGERCRRGEGGAAGGL